MAGITLEIAEARLTEYLDAEAKILAGQAFVPNGTGSAWPWPCPAATPVPTAPAAPIKRAVKCSPRQLANGAESL